MTTRRTPVIFIHGLWLHSTSWQGWADSFHDAGYEPLMPEWPGVPDTVNGARRLPEAQAGVGLADIAEAYTRVIRTLPAQPVLVGHSVGGFIAQHLLGEGLASAAVAISPGQIKGVKALAPAQAKSAFAFLRDPGNIHRAVSLNREQFRYAFANAVSAPDAEALFDAWTIPSPARPLFQLALGNFTPHSAARVNTDNASRGPLLLMSGKHDHTVPDVLTRSTYKQYRHSPAVTEYQCFEDRGHSLTVDRGWPDLAASSLSWLGTHARPMAGAR
ncbi:alpha/beta hydrolase [Streptomyces sp. NPDC054904]|uniref:alpha/beta hydrolase n=1 Tax=unclassified Streptomyces TaxID=2593676 RepID=UPI002481E6C5|nr:alpha/beta fold hydrolase [Streptomyces sp. Isolate_45]MDA5284971.1 alpha/beta fold hydrolase [Streptomyces sp. Isolate_45]